MFTPSGISYDLLDILASPSRVPMALSIRTFFIAAIVAFDSLNVKVSVGTPADIDDMLLEFPACLCKALQDTNVH